MSSLPNRFERRKTRTRAALKAAVVAVVQVKGYAAATIDDIVARADVGRGTFYLHFTDKEDALWAVIREEIDALHVELNRVYDRARVSDLPFYSYLEMFAYVQRHWDLYQVLLATGGEHLLTHRLQGHVAAEVVREIRAGAYPETRGVPAEVAAQFVTGAFARLTAWWFEQRNPASPVEMAAMFFTLMHHRQIPPARLTEASRRVNAGLAAAKAHVPAVK